MTDEVFIGSFTMSSDFKEVTKEMIEYKAKQEIIKELVYEYIELIQIAISNMDILSIEELKELERMIKFTNSRIKRKLVIEKL
jgi:hypothetical protein